MSTLEAILKKIDEKTGRPPQQSGGGYRCLCPAHDDKAPSLSVGQGNNGSVLVHCHAGCTPEAVTRALGMTMADLGPENKKPITKAGSTQPRIVATHNYTDENDKVLFQVGRTNGKKFVQRRPDGSGGFAYGLAADWYERSAGAQSWVRHKGSTGDAKKAPPPSNAGGEVRWFGQCRRVIYRLPKVVEAVTSGKWVYIVEGEKDVESLEKRGFVATTNSGGAGKWRKEYNEALRNADVVVVPDNDEPGRKHAQQVAEGLAGIAKSIRVVDLPDLPKGGDVTDWLEMGGTVEALNKLVEATEPRRNAKPKVVAPGLGKPIRETALDLAGVIAPLNEWFCRGGEIVVVECEPRVQFVPLTSQVARTDAERYATFVTKSEAASASTPIARDKMESILSSREFRAALPQIKNVFACPMPYFDKDGCLRFTKSGYDEDARAFTMADFGLDFMSATLAVEVLVSGTLCDFCFADCKTDLANALGLLVTPMATALARMQTPAIMIRGNRPGVGKGLLASLPGLILDGVEPPTASFNDDTELEKRLTARLRAGNRAVVLDNLKGRLNSPVLEAFLTASVWQGRVLGKSEIVALENHLLVIATSNGVKLTDDLARRIVWINLHYYEEDLKARRFRHTDLPGHVLKNRRLLVSALASLIRAWVEAGQPKADVVMPSFDHWAKTVGGILEVAGVRGFLANANVCVAELDTETSEMKALVRMWNERYGAENVTAKTLHELAHEHDLFSWVEAGKTGRFGKLLARFANRIFGGFKILRVGELQHVVQYALRQA